MRDYRMSASNRHMQYAWTHVHSGPAAEINRRLKLEVCHIDPCSSSQQCNYKRTSPYEVCEWDDRISLCMCISAWVREDVFAFVLCEGCFYFLNALLLNVRGECVCPCALCVRGPAVPPHTRDTKVADYTSALCVCSQVHILYISTLHTVHAFLQSCLYKSLCRHEVWSQDALWLSGPFVLHPRLYPDPRLSSRLFIPPSSCFLWYFSLWFFLS